MSRPAVDEWIRITEDTLLNWPHPAPVRALFDLTHPNVAFTPYARQQLTEFNKQLDSPMDAYGAILLSDSMISRLTAMFVGGQQGLHQNIVYRGFVRRESAIDWLLRVGT